MEEVNGGRFRALNCAEEGEEDSDFDLEEEDAHSCTHCSTRVKKFLPRLSTIDNTFKSPNRLSDAGLKINALRCRKWTHFGLSFVLYVISVAVCHTEEGEVKYDLKLKKYRDDSTSPTELWVCGFICAAQVIVMVWSLVFKITNKKEFRLNDIWVHYVAQIFNFAGVYFFMFLVKRGEDSWWHIPGTRKDADDIPVQLL